MVEPWKLVKNTKSVISGLVIRIFLHRNLKLPAHADHVGDLSKSKADPCCKEVRIHGCSKPATGECLWNAVGKE